MAWIIAAQILIFTIADLIFAFFGGAIMLPQMMAYVSAKNHLPNDKIEAFSKRFFPSKIYRVNPKSVQRIAGSEQPEEILKTFLGMLITYMVLVNGLHIMGVVLIQGALLRAYKK